MPLQPPLSAAASARLHQEEVSGLAAWVVPVGRTPGPSPYNHVGDTCDLRPSSLIDSLETPAWNGYTDTIVQNSSLARHRSDLGALPGTVKIMAFATAGNPRMEKANSAYRKDGAADLTCTYPLCTTDHPRGASSRTRNFLLPPRHQIETLLGYCGDNK